MNVEVDAVKERDADIIAIVQSCTIAWPEACQQIAGLAATARDERDALQERIGEVQAALSGTEYRIERRREWHEGRNWPPA